MEILNVWHKRDWIKEGKKDYTYGLIYKTTITIIKHKEKKEFSTKEIK